MIGGLTPNEVTIAGKVPYTLGSEVNNPKVYTLTFDQSTVKMYINNELIASAANSGNCKYLDDIYFGADYDNTEFFKGTFIRTPRVSNKVLEHHQITPSNIRVIKATNDLKIVSF